MIQIAICDDEKEILDQVSEYIASYVEKKSGKDIVIITDNTDCTSNLSAMISRFRSVFPYETRVVNISEYPLAGVEG